MSDSRSSVSPQRPPLWVGLLVCVALAAGMGLLHLALWRGGILPIAYGVPLVVCVFLRDKRLLWGLSACFIAISLLSPSRPRPVAEPPWLVPTLQALDTIAIAAVVHALIVTRDALDRRHGELARANGELEAREAMLASFLELSRSMTRDLTYEQLFSRICETVVRLFPADATAVAIIERDGDHLIVRGHHGFGPAGPSQLAWPLADSFAAQVMASGRVEAVEDLARRPELRTPQRVGHFMSSVLAAPLMIRSQAIGALELFSREPRSWTSQQFTLAEWLAGHASSILENAQMQRELDQRRREAEEEAIRKTRFLSAVSHDIRTPANAISLTSQLLAEAAAGQGSQLDLPQLAQDLRANALSLVDLVSDVLDLSRLDAAEEVELSDFALDELLADQVRQQHPTAQAKGLILRLDASGEALELRTDRVKLSRILSNLLGNAIKFTAHGSVTLRAAVEADGRLALAVSDTGVGIAPEHLPRIFDEFFQVQNPERNRAKGAGLGLAIARRLAEALGGAIAVESASGAGSTFTLSLPSAAVIQRAPRAAAAAPPIATAGDSGGALHGLRVLLVEDHDTTRRATSRLLASEGAVVLPAPDGGTGLQLLKQDRPDVLLLDLMLPDIDGREILKFLQAARPSSLKRIFAVTGDLTPSRIEEVRRLGADGLIPKPVDIERLLGLLAAPPA